MQRGSERFHLAQLELGHVDKVEMAIVVGEGGEDSDSVEGGRGPDGGREWPLWVKEEEGREMEEPNVSGEMKIVAVGGEQRWEPAEEEEDSKEEEPRQEGCRAPAHGRGRGREPCTCEEEERRMKEKGQQVAEVDGI